MLEIDGSGGGGQLCRSTVALAAVTGRSVTITGIRGDRPSPGLRPQHRAAIDLVGRLCDASVSNLDVGTESITFEAESCRGGEVSVDVGTAGSLPLVFDAVLPVSLVAPRSIAVNATGGTAVKWAPTLDHHRLVKLPLLGERGLVAAATTDREGYHPAGGGRATLRVAPSTLEGFEMSDRGPVRSCGVVSTASTGLADNDVAERQASAAVEALEDAGIAVSDRVVRYVDADSPGTSVCIVLSGESWRAGFDAIGERGVTAESVGLAAVEDVRAFNDSAGAVDRHTADQLVPFLGVAGGRIRVPAVTDHIRTHVELCERFDIPITIEETSDGATLSAPGISL